MENRRIGFPLSFAKTDEKYEVQGVFGNEKDSKHLREIGFYSGAIIDVKSRSNSSLVIKIGESRIALDSEICSKIYIKELELQNNEQIEK